MPETHPAAHARGPAGPVPLRVLLVDDHPLFRRGVRRALEAGGAIAVVGEAGDGEAALRLAERLRPDVVLCDLNLPGMSGLDVTRRLAARQPGLPVVILTLHQEDAARAAARRAGAAAYLSKEVAPDQLVALLRRAGRGERLEETFPPPAAAAAAGGGPAARLSPRETAVLALIAQGYANRGIAERLGISEQTVKNHLTAILRKLAVADRTQAVLYALRRGWLDVATLEVVQPGRPDADA